MFFFCSSAIAATHNGHNIDGKSFSCHGGFAEMKDGKNQNNYDLLFKGTCKFEGENLYIAPSSANSHIIELATGSRVAKNVYNLNSKKEQASNYIWWHIEIDYRENNFSF